MGWWSSFWGGIFGGGSDDDERIPTLGGTRGQNDGYEEETGDGGEREVSPSSDGG